MRKRIGVDDVDAELRKRPSYFRLATANAPSQANDVSRHDSRRKVELNERSAEKQRNSPCYGEIRPERQRNSVVAALEYDEPDTNHRSDERRQQNDQRQHLPAQPGAEGGKQLEVAVAHAFLAAD